MKLPIYLDHASTTPVEASVLEAMLPYFSENFGNPASKNHIFGWKAEAAVEKARQQVADLIGAQAQEILFTSGATESNHLALTGSFTGSDAHVITSSIEHKSVLETCHLLEQRATQVTYLPVDGFGMVSVEAVKAAIRPNTKLISIMSANNETGTLQPITEIGATAKARGIYFHVDASQSAGKLQLDVQTMGIDLLSMSAHKMYGPKGVGALYVRRRNPRVSLTAQARGGGQERGLRPGTLNVPGIVGFGAAAELCKVTMLEAQSRVRELGDQFFDRLCSRLEGVTLNGHAQQRIPGYLNISIEGVGAESLLLESREIAASTGSACASATLEPSHVLRAMGLSDDEIHSSVRFCFGRGNTLEEVGYAAERVIFAVQKLRKDSVLHLRMAASKSELLMKESVL